MSDCPKFGYDVLCPNLLSREEPYDYNDEDIAYRNFVGMGFVQFAETARAILRQLRSVYRTLYVVGYSVGATTAWLCSVEPGLIDAFVGYYGSRIRDYLDVHPQCPALLLFPQEEPFFDVDELVAKLRGKFNVDVRKYDRRHGFAALQNKNSSELASEKSFEDTIRFIMHSRRFKGC